MVSSEGPPLLIAAVDTARLRIAGVTDEIGIAFRGLSGVGIAEASRFCFGKTR